MRNQAVRVLTFCALMLAFAIIATVMPLFRIPGVGSVTAFRMLWLAIPGYFFGVRAGFLTTTTYGLSRILTATTILHPAQFALDYFLGFVVFGVSGFFMNVALVQNPDLSFANTENAGMLRRLRNAVVRYWRLVAAHIGLAIGVTVGTLLRLLLSTTSGVLFFTQWAPEGTVNYWFWSFGVNFSVIFPELALILVLIALPPFAMALSRVKGFFGSRDVGN